MTRLLAAMLCMCVAFAALGTAAACMSKKPSGTAADQDALLACSMGVNISHATFTCSAAAMLEGVDYEVVTNTSCNQVQRYALPHAPADCGFEMVFPRPSTCGSGHGDGAEGVQNIDVSLDAHVVQHGGTIVLDAGVSGSVSVARRNTSTTHSTASWLLQVDGSFTTMVNIIPPHFVSIVQAFTVGRTYTIMTYFTLPVPTIHAVVNGGPPLVWSDTVCPDGTPVCFQSASFTPDEACTPADVSAGRQEFELALAARAECGDEDADKIACVKGDTDVTYATRTLQVPCENPSPLPIVADIGTEFSLTPVASSDRLVEASITMTDTSGDKYAFTVSSLRALVYPQVAQSVPQDTVLAMTPQVFELVVDGDSTAHASAFGVSLDNTPKTQHDFRVSLPLHVASYDIAVHLGNKVIVQLEGSVSFAQRRLQALSDTPRELLSEKKLAPITSAIEVGAGYVKKVCRGSDCEEPAKGSTECSGMDCVPVWAMAVTACAFVGVVAAVVVVARNRGACSRGRDMQGDFARAVPVAAIVPHAHACPRRNGKVDGLATATAVQAV